MAGGFVRGGLPMRAFVVNPFRLQHGFQAHRFHFRRAWGTWGAWGGGAVFGPPGFATDDPTGSVEDPYRPLPPVWRECISQTRMVPSSEHAGLTPVVVTRCWRRN
jgi:hypothetical protein